MNVKSLIFIVLSLFLNYSAKAGLNEFTKLDEIKGWVIERRFDSDLNQIICRASIPLYGAWFSTRIRLNKNDELIIPSGFKANSLTNDFVLSSVKASLMNCRSGLIYIPAE